MYQTIQNKDIYFIYRCLILCSDSGQAKGRGDQSGISCGGARQIPDDQSDAGALPGGEEVQARGGEHLLPSR